MNETVAQTIGISTVSPHKVYERQYRAGVQQAAAALESVIHELASNPGALTDSEPLARELTALAASFHRVGTEKASTSLREKASKVGVLLDEAESDCTAALKRL
ncbi:MAG TPA: hypothetical protein VMA83_00475 [Solirubrobacteraceae bacterium]|nr:hypothetical protein [Solirubrobacteraceae bacterium]